jgi:hypothetical protein
MVLREPLSQADLLPNKQGIWCKQFDDWFGVSNFWLLEQCQHNPLCDLLSKGYNHQAAWQDLTLKF